MNYLQILSDLEKKNQAIFERMIALNQYNTLLRAQHEQIKLQSSQVKQRAEKVRGIKNGDGSF